MTTAAQGRDDPIPVTGLGSMPGTDSREATRVVVGELDVPHVVELPGRGPGGDMIGRALALVRSATGEFGAETVPTGWRLAGGRTGAQAGRPMRRGAAWLAEDVDRLEEALHAFAGSVKVQVAGPWTVAASLESVRGTRLVADPAACADLAAALAEAVSGHLRDVRRRLPAAQVVLQVDEPLLPAVLAGRVRTPSGRGALRVPEPAEASAALAALVVAGQAAGAAPALVHCCAAAVPFALLGRAGFDAVSVDTAVLGSRADDDLGAWWDRGGLVVLGVAPAVDPEPVEHAGLPESLVRDVESLWHRIGVGVAEVGARTWLSPACGLAGASPGWAREVGGQLRSAARMLQAG